MRVLIACEEWGRVRDAFLARGHDAWSCDLQPTRVPGPHLQCDVREVLGQQWDLLIAHPVCRYLTNSGVRWLHTEPGRWEKMRKGAEFFNLFVRAEHIPKRCIENPVMHGHAAKLIDQVGELQYVQPHWFGDPFTKKTGLRLVGLPKLERTHWMKKDDIIAECHKMGPSPERESLRSRTYPAVAEAMARTWG